MKKENIAKILLQEPQKKEKKQILQEMLKSQEEIIKILKNGTDFEKHYKKGAYHAERISRAEEGKQENFIPFIESAVQEIHRMKAPHLELRQNIFKVKTKKGQIFFDLWDETELVSSLIVNLDKKSVETKIGTTDFPAIREKVEKIFQPFFKVVDL